MYQIIEIAYFRFYSRKLANKGPSCDLLRPTNDNKSVDLSANPEAHYFECAIPVLNLSHGILTDKSIFRLLFSRNTSVPVYRSTYR